MTMKNSLSRRQEILKTKFFVRYIGYRLGAESPYKLALLFDSHFPDLSSTQASGKWSGYWTGQRALSHSRKDFFKHVCEWQPGMDVVYENGPANLWLALWGPVHVLWALVAPQSPDEDTVSVPRADHLDQLANDLRLRVEVLEDGDCLNALAHLAEAVALLRLMHSVRQDSSPPRTISAVGKMIEDLQQHIENNKKYPLFDLSADVRAELSWLVGRPDGL